MSKIKSFIKFNEGFQDDINEIENDISKKYRFSVERSGFDPDFKEDVILIDFRTSDDWEYFYTSFLIAKESSASMILIKNYSGDIKKYSVCQIYKIQFEEWIESNKLIINSDSLIIGFELDLGGKNIEDFLMDPRPDDGGGYL